MKITSKTCTKGTMLKQVKECPMEYTRLGETYTVEYIEGPNVYLRHSSGSGTLVWKRNIANCFEVVS